MADGQLVVSLKGMVGLGLAHQGLAHAEFIDDVFSQFVNKLFISSALIALPVISSTKKKMINLATIPLEIKFSGQRHGKGKKGAYDFDKEISYKANISVMGAQNQNESWEV